MTKIRTPILQWFLTYYKFTILYNKYSLILYLFFYSKRVIECEINNMLENTIVKED